MKLLQALLVSVFTLTGALLLTGCSKDSALSQNTTSQGEGSQPASSQGTQDNYAVVQNVRQAAKRAADGNELKNFALAYNQYALLNMRGPTKLQDLKGSLTPKMVEAFQDDAVYVVNWGIQNPSSNAILAYANEPDSYGTRLVAKGDGTVVRMNKDEFEKAKSGR